MHWVGHGVKVAVKSNGTANSDCDAIGSERMLFEQLLVNPHEHILPVYGLCTDAPDGKMRLVMKYCENGSLSAFLHSKQPQEAQVQVCCLNLIAPHRVVSLVVEVEWALDVAAGWTFPYGGG
jgi:hypothetical protein